MANRKNREDILYNAVGTRKCSGVKKAIILSVLVTFSCILSVTVIASDFSLEEELNFADFQDKPSHPPPDGDGPPPNDGDSDLSPLPRPPRNESGPPELNETLPPPLDDEQFPPDHDNLNEDSSNQIL